MSDTNVHTNPDGSTAVVEVGAFVGSGAWIGAGAVVESGARVASRSKAVVCGPIGSRGARLTAYWSVTPDGEGVEFVTGCFCGTGEQLIAESELTHGVDHPHTQDYTAAVTLLTRLVLASLPDGHPAKTEAHG